jgi:Ca-activated chloride channel family protein
MSNISLLHPYFLLVIPFYYLLKWLIKYKNIELFSNVRLLEKFSKNGFNYNKIAEFIVVLLIAISLATPIKKTFKNKTSIKAHSIALLLDASSSMQEQNRFNIAKNAVKEFLKSRKNDEIALIFFADSTYIASPLTYDKSSLIKMLNYIKLGVAGNRETALYEALYQSTKLFKNKDSKVAILLSDGIDSTHTLSKNEIIDIIKKEKLKVYTIALGKSGDVDIAFLKRVAKVSGGKFFISLNPQELDKIYKSINSLQKNKVTSKVVATYINCYKYPIYLAIFLLLLLFINTKNKTILIASILLLIAILIPHNSQNISQNSKNKTLTLALDLSYYMQSDDIYPNRLEFAKSKILELLKTKKDTKIALLGFANNTYLITPPTNDYSRLKYAIEHLDLENIKRDKANFLALFKAIKELSFKPNRVVILTSGGENESFKEALLYAKKHHIKPTIFAIGTTKGGIVKIKNSYLKDKNGEIKIVKLNPNLKEFKKLDNAKYIKATINSTLSTQINKSSIFSKIKTTKEPIIYILLILSLLLLLISTKGVRL